MNRATALPIFAGLASLTLTACQTPQQLAEHDALLIEPDAEARAEVRTAASTLLGGTPVLLAPDAFTQDSRLTLERMPRRTLIDLPLADRARFAACAPTTRWPPCSAPASRLAAPPPRSLRRRPHPS